MFYNGDYAILWFVAEWNFLRKSTFDQTGYNMGLFETLVGDKNAQFKHYGRYLCFIHNKWSILLYTDITDLVQIITDFSIRI